MREAAFLDAWRRGIEIAGPQWFGEGFDFPGATKWDLQPRYDDIVEAIGWLSSGEAAFLAGMYSFFNAHTGGKMLRQLEIHGLADLAASVDEPRRKVLADLFLSYEGW